MMNPWYAAGIQASRDAIDAVLVRNGKSPLAANGDFVEVYKQFDIFPVYGLVHKGSAPLGFLLAPDFEIWIGDQAEVVVVPNAEANAATLNDVIDKMLHSQIRITVGKIQTTYEAYLPDGSRWVRFGALGPGHGRTSRSFEAYL